MNENPKVTALVRRLYIEAFTELLSAYGLADRVHEYDARRNGARRESRQSYVSVLGLTAHGLCIACMLDFDVALLASLHPARANAPDAPVSPSDLADWCRELNNQLGGRLKNKLIQRGKRGSDLMLGLPSLLKGIDISSIAQDDLDMYQVSYVADGRRMVVTLATQIAADTTLTEEAMPDTDEVLREGAIALF